jgi:hypothetical protein|tara:strand:- start:795 stop:1181 length:387 start_codon:yes stop_codon:yes gene_type:complete
MTKTMTEELYQHTIDKLTEFKDWSSKYYGCDLHHYIFNESMYLIGHYNCREWIKKHDLDVFEMIDIIVQYEREQFGQIHTDLSTPENVVNMYVYIEGEEILNETEHLKDVWDEELTGEDYDKIIKELS